MRRLVLPIVLCIAMFGTSQVDGWTSMLASRTFVNSDPQSLFRLIAITFESIPESSLLLAMGVGLVCISRLLRRHSSRLEIGPLTSDPASVDGDATIA